MMDVDWGLGAVATDWRRVVRVDRGLRIVRVDRRVVGIDDSGLVVVIILRLVRLVTSPDILRLIRLISAAVVRWAGRLISMRRRGTSRANWEKPDGNRVKTTFRTFGLNLPCTARAISFLPVVAVFVFFLLIQECSNN